MTKPRRPADLKRSDVERSYVRQDVDGVDVRQDVDGRPLSDAGRRSNGLMDRIDRRPLSPSPSPRSGERGARVGLVWGARVDFGRSVWMVLWFRLQFHHGSPRPLGGERSGERGRVTNRVRTRFAVPGGSLGLATRLTCVVMLLASFATAQTTMQDSADVSLNDGIPRQVREVGIDQKIGDSIPLNLPLTDSSGRKVKTGYFIDGQRPTIVTLNYSNCPMLCNVQLNALTKSLRSLDLKIGEDFNILTVSIDPKESTAKIAETKDKYVAQLTSAQPTAPDGWAFCTADQPIITKLAETLGFRYRYDRRTKEYYHAAMLAFVSPEGVITRYSLSVDFPVNDLRKALVEAGDGKTGTVFDQFILYCFQFDPDANSYTMAGRKVMYFGGMIFAGGFFALLLPYWIRRDRNDDPNHPDRMFDSVNRDAVPPPASVTKQTNLFSGS